MIALPAEVLGSAVVSGVEQGDDRAGVGIKGFDPIGFPQVTPRAGPGQIDQVRGTATGAWHGMFDVKGGSLKSLVHAAVFATSLGSCLDPLHKLTPGGH
jgi:hypothetical protein